MKVLVIGSGNMGAGLVKLLSAAGRQVVVAGCDPAKVQALAQPLRWLGSGIAPTGIRRN